MKPHFLRRLGVLLAVPLMLASGAALAQTARLQVAHLAPFASGGGTSVTVRLNGAAALTNVVYGDSTAYLDVPAGPTTVEIVPTGTSTVAITATANLVANQDYTAIAIGDGVRQPLALRVLEDGNPTPPSGQFLLRLGHLAPFASGDAVRADVRLQDGTPILQNITFGDVAAFLPLAAGSYDLKVTAPGGNPVLIDPAPATFTAGQVVSAFATGNGPLQPLGVFALPRNAAGSFLPLAAPVARVQVAHLAPFAAGNGSSVTVRINGANALTNIVYGNSTAYLEVPAGPTTVDILPTGTSTVAITATANLVANQDYTVIAIGDGVRQPLSLRLLEDGNAVPASGQFLLRLGHLAPFASGDAVRADVRLQDGTPLLQNVTFGDVAAFLPLAAGSYDLKVTAPGGTPVLIDPAPATFTAGQVVSAFATGNGPLQPLGVFALPRNGVGSFLPLSSTPQVARVQVAHLAPFAAGNGSSVTVRINGTNALTNIVYGNSTAYLEVPAGPTTVDILPTGSSTVAITATATLAAGQDYTVIAVGDGARQPLALRVLEDGNPTPPSGQFLLRLGHLAPFASGDAVRADVRLQDGTPILQNITFGDVAAFLPLAAGSYDLKVTAPGGTPVLIDPAPATFTAGQVVSAFATGNGPLQPLGVFALPRNAVGSFLPLAPPAQVARLQVAHLAPFAAGNGTSVLVRLNGQAALADVVYGNSTGYIDVPAGPTTVDILPTGTSTVAITATANLVANQNYTAIAIGDGVRQPLSLRLLQDGTATPGAGQILLRLGHLAPFASGDAVRADVRLQDGTPLIENITFGDVTNFAAIPAGTYDLAITAPGGSPVLIDPAPVTFGAGQIVSAFATGNGPLQPLGVFALPRNAAGGFVALEALFRDGFEPAAPGKLDAPAKSAALGVFAPADAVETRIDRPAAREAGRDAQR
jgi:hypothetical protein